MPIPIPAIAALLLGGGMAAQEVSSRFADKRLRRRTAENWDRLEKMREGQKLDDAAAVLQVTGATPATKAPQAPTLRGPATKAPGAKEAPIEPSEPEPEAIARPRRAGHKVTPRHLFEHNINMQTGNMTVKMTENAAYFKLEQEKAFASDMQQGVESNMAQGMPRGIARNKAYVESAIRHGLQGSVADWKGVYPDMTEAEKYKALRSGLINHTQNGLDVERARRIMQQYFPDVEPETWNKVANDVYQINKAMFLDQATQLKEIEGFSGDALKVEAELLAGRMASDQGFDAYLSPEEQERIGHKITRVEDLPEGPVKAKLMVGFGKDAVIGQGHYAEAAAQVAAEANEKIRTETLTRKRAAAGAQAEQIEPLIGDLEEMVLGLNTQVDLAPRLWEGAKMWMYGKAQKGPYDVKVGDRTMNVGVLVSVYTSASKSFLGTLARVFGGERGVLTQQDIERISEAIPHLGDSKGKTVELMARLRNQMQDIMRRAKIAEKDPTYINPKFVPNDPAGIRAAENSLDAKSLLKGVKGSIKSLTEGY